MKSYLLKCWTGRKQKRTFRIDLTETFRHSTILKAVKDAIQKEHPEVKRMKRCRLEMK